jgi:hypothetical protein
MEIQQSTLMVTMDALLDTRMGTLLSLGEDVLNHVILHGDYYTRVEDKFLDVDQSMFKAAYENRDKEILKKSGVTQVILMIQEYVNKMQNQNLVTPFHRIPKIVINSYPYLLTDAEIETFKRLMIRYTQKNALVDVVHMSNETLTPTYVKKHLAMLITYDYHQWLEFHSLNKNLETVTCPEVTVVGPMIYFNGPMKHSDILALKKENLSPFEGIEAIANPLINLTLFPIDLFSFVLKIPKQEPQKT